MIHQTRSNLGEREKRLLARWVRAFVPKVVEDLRKERPRSSQPNSEVPDAPRFKLGHQAFDDARTRHQMIHKAFEIASAENCWCDESAVRCPRCGKVTLGSEPSECSGCGKSIPRRNLATSKPISSATNSRMPWVLGVLAIAAIITLALSTTRHLFKSYQGNTFLIATNTEQQSTKLPGEWRTIQSALRLLHHFHQATSIEEKCSLVNDFPDRTTTLTQYYQQNGFEPSQINQIVKTGWYEVEGLVTYLIHGVYSNGNAFLAFVCEEEGHLALDWQAFTGHNAVPFAHFLDQEISGPTEMRVLAQRVSGSALSEIAPDYHLYRLQDRYLARTCWALVKKHSEAGKSLASLIAPPVVPSFSLFSTTNEVATTTHHTPPRRLILTLRHDTSLGVVIDKVVSTEWLSQPVPADAHVDI